jgi:hypothetical protein
MSDNATMKQRFFLPNGQLVELFAYGDTTPEELENLVQNATLLDEIATGAGLIPANQTAGATAVSNAQTNAVETARPGNEVFKCVSIDILPQADGRSKVEFYGDDFKQPRNDYPTTSSLWTPDKLQELIAPYYEFQQDTFKMAGTFAVDMMVEYYFSKKTNQAGNPYKNVAKVHASEGAAPPVKAPEKKAEEAVSKQDEIPF